MSDVEEREHVGECPIDGCGQSFIGVTPDDVRNHIKEDHDDPLGCLYIFPDRSVEPEADRQEDDL